MMRPKRCFSTVFLGAAAFLLLLPPLSAVTCEGSVDSAAPAPAIAGDLGKVAYVLSGDIYVIEPPDGEPQRLTQDSDSSYPVWSPSGGWLLFVKRGLFWVMRGDGSDQRLVPGGDAAWSPVIDRLAYSGNGAVFVENADGSGRREVARLEGDLWGLQWSPDGRRLAYGEELRAPVRWGRLWVVEVNTGRAPTQLYASTSDGVLAAGWTADGQYVLFWRDVQFSASMMADGLPLLAIPFGGGEARELAMGPIRPGMWSVAPDGTRVAMTVPAGRCSWTRKQVLVADADSGESRYLTGPEQVSIQPAWSPDGERVAFVAKLEMGDGPGGSGDELEKLAADRRIWVMNSDDGSEARQLTSDEAYRDERPLWSRDGGWLLFARLNEEREASLWLMPSSGGEPQMLVDLAGNGKMTGYYTNIGWGELLDWWRGWETQSCVLR
jgi:Tol biopolymer transport system component